MTNKLHGVNRAYIVVAAIVVVAASSILSYWFSHGALKPQHGTYYTAIQNSSYMRAIGYMMQILRDAKGNYTTALKAKLPVNVDELSLSLILNSTIINDTTLLINGTPYRYIIVYIYDHDENISLRFNDINVDGILVSYIPPPTSVTYTGGRPFTYRIYYNGKSCEATIWVIPFMMGGEVYAESYKACEGIYLVSIYVSPMNYSAGAYRESVWVVLVKVR